MIHHPHRDQDKDAKLLKKILKKQLERKKKRKSAFKYVNSTEFYKFTNSRSPASFLYSGLNLNHN